MATPHLLNLDGVSQALHCPLLACLLQTLKSLLLHLLNRCQFISNLACVLNLGLHLDVFF